MNNEFLAGQAIAMVLQKYRFQTVLDIGCGQGLHTQEFRRHAKTVTGLDASNHWGEPDILGDFCSTVFSEPFDLVWCSHTLEHQVNVQQFLLKIFSVLQPGGILAITVPPAKPYIVGGHVSIWNAGLLLYNLILAGFDCRNAMVRQYDYNISVIVRKAPAYLPPLKMDNGDIEALSQYFPFEAAQNFNGDIMELNWESVPDSQLPASQPFGMDELDMDHFIRYRDGQASDLSCKSWALRCAELQGDIAEIDIAPDISLQSLLTNTFSKAILPIDSAHPAPLDLHSPFSILHIGATAPVAYVLARLERYIAPGTVIVFDAFCDWENMTADSQNSALEILKVWMAGSGYRIRILSCGTDHAASVIIA